MLNKANFSGWFALFLLLACIENHFKFIDSKNPLNDGRIFTYKSPLT